MRFSPFVANLWNDPLGPSDGVVSLDSVVETELVETSVAKSTPTSPPANPAVRLSVSGLLGGLTSIDSLLSEGWLRRADEACFYLYSCGYSDSHGARRQFMAVLGVSEDNTQDTSITEGTPDLLRRLEPCVAFSDAEGFESLLMPVGLPVARATTRDGNHHRLWPIHQRGLWDAFESIALPIDAEDCRSVTGGGATVGSSPDTSSSVSRLVALAPRSDAPPPFAVGMLVLPS